MKLNSNSFFYCYGKREDNWFIILPIKKIKLSKAQNAWEYFGIRHSSSFDEIFIERRKGYCYYDHVDFKEVEDKKIYRQLIKIVLSNDLKENKD